MQKIYLTEREASHLPIFNKNGNEAIIHWYDDNGSKVLIKLFRKRDKSVLKNKKNKLLLLKDMKLDILTNPLKFVYVENKFAGYSTNPKSEYQSFLDLNLQKAKKNKLFYIKTLKNIIDFLHTQGIIIGDFNPQNFLFKNGEIALCDIDNWKISNFSHDITTNLFEQYTKHNPIDKNLDIYLFNILTIAILKNQCIVDVLDYIKNNRTFFNRNVDEQANKLLDIENGYQGEYIIDSILENSPKRKRLILK